MVEKEKSLLYVNPKLSLEWHPMKNGDLTPTDVSYGSHKKVWWLGRCGHEWEAVVKSRNNGCGCPICSGRTILPGVNDLQTVHPEILSEWDFLKNDVLKPFDIAPNSHTKVWWKCKNNHSWQASPNHRISKGRGCPYCSHNPIVLPGETDLATIHPEIAAEWHPSQNGLLLPNQVTANSSKRVWWKCSKGHEWKTAINHRANGSGCPYCAKSMQTSFPEQAVYYYVKKAYPDAINGYTKLFNHHGMELDVYIPSVSIGIEYDGVAFHRLQKYRKRECDKYAICHKNNIMLIRIREDLDGEIDNICDCAIFVKTDLNSAILELSKYLPKLFDIDVIRDEAEIRAKYYSDLE